MSEPTPAPQILAALRGARVRRVDVPAPDLLAFTVLLGGDEITLVVSVSERAAGLGLVGERPRGAPAGSVAQLFRKYTEGGVIEGASTPAARVVDLSVRRADVSCVVRASVRRRGGGVVLLVDGRALGGLPRGAASVTGTHEPAPEPGDWPRDLDELRVAGAALLARRGGESDKARDEGLRRSLSKDRARITRRIAAIEGDLARAAAASTLREDGAALLAGHAGVSPRASSAVVPDPVTGEDRRITLDPARTAIENAEALFTRAKKLDRGATIARARLEAARTELARIDEALRGLASGEEAPQRPTEPGAAPPRAVGASAPRRRPYRTYVLEDGSTILVGRSARDNDALTFRHAAATDELFHARGRTGSHVILRAEAGRAVSPEAREAAALLAAHFSAARGDTAADVLTALRKDLRRGAAPGSIVARVSGTLRVKLDSARIEALLARERA